MRGKGNGATAGIGLVGITPAYAGKRAPRHGRPARGRDHPRVCGEKRSSLRWAIASVGSPPRMRGKGPRWCPGRIGTRITPAYAGKSGRLQVWHLYQQDHPRVCGEKGLDGSSVKTISGSPPRMRGKASPRAALPAASGITPAYAGKSSPSSGSAGRRGDHPRVCGEKQYEPRAQQGHLGSPPRMRGKAGLLRRSLFAPRITPAHAGKRGRRDRSSRPGRDHPRACGEKNSNHNKRTFFNGSPPRMRGKVTRPPGFPGGLGITPAHAGKSRSL